MTDSAYMRRALELARHGCGFTSPNPMVGAVIVKDGEIIGEGYHARYGEAHAERNALNACAKPPEGATLYVTLEPCCHHGKQPPCAHALVEAGIRRVVVGSADPNPLVNGGGVRYLRAHGVEVVEGVLREECDRLNDVFFHYIRTGEPFVAMKYAMTMDGKIAAYTGASKWITGEAARAHAHGLRLRYAAVMVGLGTVLADDPLLTCRVEGGRNPLRVVCDTKLRIPLASRLVATASQVPTLIAACEGEPEKRAALERAGCRVMTVPARAGRVDLRALMARLGKEGVDSVLIEGGGALNWAALESGIVRKVYAYIAPKLLGGETAKTPVEGTGAASPDGGIFLKDSRIEVLSEDILIESEVCGGVYGDH